MSDPFNAPTAPYPPSWRPFVRAAEEIGASLLREALRPPRPVDPAYRPPAIPAGYPPHAEVVTPTPAPRPNYIPGVDCAWCAVGRSLAQTNMYLGRAYFHMSGADGARADLAPWYFVKAREYLGEARRVIAIAPNPGIFDLSVDLNNVHMLIADDNRVGLGQVVQAQRALESLITLALRNAEGPEPPRAAWPSFVKPPPFAPPAIDAQEPESGHHRGSSEARGQDGNRAGSAESGGARHGARRGESHPAPDAERPGDGDGTPGGGNAAASAERVRHD